MGRGPKRRHRKPGPVDRRLYRFDFETREKILSALRGTLRRGVAAAMAGISGGTLSDWVRRGAAGESPALVKFREQVLQAEAEGEGTASLYLVKSAAAGSVEAQKFLLERRYPEKWGRGRALVDVTSGGEKLAAGASVQVVQFSLPDDGSGDDLRAQGKLEGVIDVQAKQLPPDPPTAKKARRPRRQPAEQAEVPGDGSE